MLLALLIERVAVTGFHEFVEMEVFAPAALALTGFLRSDDLPGDAALGYVEKTGNRTNVLHLPVRGNGDGGAYTTVSDVHLFWRAVLAGRVVGPELVVELTRPRNVVPEEDMRYAAGVWLHATGPQLIMAGGLSTAGPGGVTIDDGSRGLIASPSSSQNQEPHHGRHR